MIIPQAYQQWVGTQQPFDVINLQKPQRELMMDCGLIHHEGPTTTTSEKMPHLALCCRQLNFTEHGESHCMAWRWEKGRGQNKKETVAQRDEQLGIFPAIR